jgi:Tol biopolymer transport system component
MLLVIGLALPVTHAQNINIGTVNCHDNRYPLLWSPNNAWVAFSGSTAEGAGVFWLDIANHRLNPLATANSSASVLSWSPVSAYVAYLEHSPTGESEIYVADVTAGTVSNVTGDVTVEQIDTALVAHNWSGIAFTSNRHSAQDIYVWTTDGRTKRITNDPAEEVLLAFSPDGTRIVFSYVNNTNLYVVNTNTGWIERVTSNYDSAITPTWSPDGSQFVFARTNGDIVLSDADGDDTDEVVEETDFISFHGWSPNGVRLLFTGSNFGGTDLYSVNTQSKWVYRFTNTPTLEIAPRWLPDSRSVLYTAMSDGNEDILVSGINTSTLNLTNNNLPDKRFDLSPDGSRVIFSNLAPGRYDADYYVVPTSGGAPQKFLAYAGPLNLAWSPNGQQIAACLSGGTTLTTTIQILNMTG